MSFFVILSDSRSGDYLGEGQYLTKKLNEAKKYASFEKVAEDFESGDDFIIQLDDKGQETARFNWNEHVSELRRQK